MEGDSNVTHKYRAIHIDFYENYRNEHAFYISINIYLSHHS